MRVLLVLVVPSSGYLLGFQSFQSEKKVSMLP